MGGDVERWAATIEEDETFLELLYEVRARASMAGQLLVAEHELVQGVRKARVEVGPPDEFLALPFDEAIAQWARRLNLSPEEAFDALGRLREDAFTSRVLTASHLRQVAQDALTTIQTTGGGREAFVAAVREGELTFGIAPTQLGYLNTIFETNMASAYGRGRTEQLSRPEVVSAVPFRIYTAVVDSRTRPDHAALDGKAWDARASSEWIRFQGPIYYNCRCQIRAETRVDESALSRVATMPFPAFA